MADHVLLPIRQLRERRIERWVVEHGVVAETTRSLGLVEDDALRLALRRGFAAARLDQGDHAPEARRAPERGHAGEGVEKLGAALRVVEPLAAVAGGEHAGGADARGHPQ